MVLSGDPFIIRLYQKLYSRYPNAWELNVQNYNKGSWSNYGTLKRYISEYQDNLKKVNQYRQMINGNWNEMQSARGWKNKLEEYGMENMNIPAKYFLLRVFPKHASAAAIYQAL